MELLLDPGPGGALRGLRAAEPELGAVHVPEAVARMHEGDEGTKGIAGEGELPAGEPEVAEALVIVRRRLWQRMARPMPAVGAHPPRGFTSPF